MFTFYVTKDLEYNTISGLRKRIKEFSNYYRMYFKIFFFGKITEEVWIFVENIFGKADEREKLKNKEGLNI